ncbi:hypothetical protein FLONG3_8000 [Fusarium longipes]|uniref:Uncharacterized protein n=1 Tax=Fusarium longipes TaxID=694270 RepID=A0A395SA37_9HYPO|nr:hypothetical protein FLONG3_8000 [Fusarium longipes]
MALQSLGSLSFVSQLTRRWAGKIHATAQNTADTGDLNELNSNTSMTRFFAALSSLFGNEPYTEQQAGPIPAHHTVPNLQDEPGRALQGTELKYYSKPIPERLRTRFFDLKVLYNDSLYDFISKRKKNPGTISMKLRYLGLTQQHTELYIVIQCDKRVARYIKKFFAQKHVLEELFPDFRVFVLDTPLLEVADDDTIQVLSGSLPDKTICGVRVTVSIGGISVGCSLGGVIMVETDRARLYGLIAGHPLKIIQSGLSDKQAIYRSYESSLFEEQEEDDDNDSDSDDTFTGMSTPSSPVHYDFERTNDNDIRAKFSIGTVVHDSLDISSGKNSDWALVELDQKYALPNVVVPNWQSQVSDFKDFQTEISHYYVDSLDTALKKKVFVLKQDGSRIAELSLNTTSLMMSPGSVFMNVHDLIMKDGSSLCPGDSGLWVVDAKTSCLYGHIVSVDAFGEAQVMPVQSTFRSIAEELKAAKVSLATSLVVKQLSAVLEEPYSFTVSGSHTLESRPSPSWTMSWERELLRSAEEALCRRDQVTIDEENFMRKLVPIKPAVLFDQVDGIGTDDLSKSEPEINSLHQRVSE